MINKPIMISSSVRSAAGPNKYNRIASAISPTILKPVSGWSVSRSSSVIHHLSLAHVLPQPAAYPTKESFACLHSRN